MKLLLLGSTGRTGQQILSRALALHYDVTVLVRNPTKLNLQPPELKIIVGDVMDSQTLLKALRGQDAVISALGRGQSLRSKNLITNAVNKIIPAMYESNVQRLIFLSGFGAGETFGQANLLQKIIFRTFLLGIYSDKARAERKIRNSELDWTLVYPVKFINTPSRSQYEAAGKLTMKGFPEIARADVAEFMMQELKNNSFLKKAVILK